MVDAGNHTYATVMCMLMFTGHTPRVRQYIEHCCNEKLGDYIEAVLGIPLALPRSAALPRVRKIIEVLTKMISTLARFDQEPVNTPDPVGFTRQIKLSDKSILRNLGRPLDVILDFWEVCNQMWKVADAFRSVAASPGAAPRANFGWAWGAAPGASCGTAFGATASTAPSAALPMRTAKEPLRPPPPPVRWFVLLDPHSNQHYYWNIETGQTTWEKPKEPFHSYESRPPVRWFVLLDPNSNQRYYGNKETGLTTWEKPNELFRKYESCKECSSA